MSRFTWEIIIMVIFGLFGGALLISSYVSGAWRALLAWAPVWLAALFIEDWFSLGWDWLFWLILAVGVVALLLAALFESGYCRALVRVVGMILFAWVIVAGLVGMHFPTSDDKTDASNVTKTTDTPKTPAPSESPDLGDSFTDKTAKDLLALLPNATKDDVRFGDEVDDSSHTVEAGSAGFNDNGKTYLETQTDIKDFFASGTKKSDAAKKRVAKAIRKAGYGNDEVARAMSGEGYIKMQLTKASQILGTSYFEGGKVKVLGDWRQSKPNDIYWLFITKDKRIVAGALLRADCHNPGGKMIRIVKPGIPEKPPVGCAPSKCPPTEECPPETPHGTPPNCKDGAESGPAHNPQFPDQQKPNKLPADPKYSQPTKPSDPPATYTEPTPEPAPTTPRSTPAPTAQPSAPAPDDPGEVCILSPGKDHC